MVEHCESTDSPFPFLPRERLIARLCVCYHEENEDAIIRIHNIFNSDERVSHRIVIAVYHERNASTRAA